MSNDFSQYDQQQNFDSAPPPVTAPRQSSGCGKGCLIGLIILGILMALFVGGFIWMVNHIVQNMTDDPKEIASRLKEIYPTARLPEAYSGRVALKFDIWKVKMDMMIFTTDDADVAEDAEVLTGNSLILFSFKMPGMNQEELENSLQISNNTGTVIEKKPVKIQAGEYEFAGFRQKVQRRREGEEKRTYYQILLPLGNATMLMMQSDKDQVDEVALKQFLLTIAKDCPNASMIEKMKEKK
ncbi:MAG TPA: hypothetical protein PLN21_04505 [Gemmatales bacterium]|nr:hypothetical protein [Gemmatales bacterium]